MLVDDRGFSPFPSSLQSLENIPLITKKIWDRELERSVRDGFTIAARCAATLNEKTKLLPKCAVGRMIAIC